MQVVETNLRFAYNPGIRSATTDLILHHACAKVCDAKRIHADHLSRGWAGIAYHYLIRKDGTIERGRPENWRGGHTEGWNYTSIGICFEGNFEEDHMSNAQLEAGQALVADIRSRYPNIKVGKHKDYNATACPGANFPFTLVVNPVTGSPEDDLPSPDNTPSEWAKAPIEWATASGISDGTRPHDALTREEGITMLFRYNKA